jgi:SAM-dependent methyltransferase
MEESPTPTVSAADFYNERAPIYDATMQELGYTGHVILGQELARLSDPPREVFDLGAGTGLASQTVLEHFAPNHVLAVDTSLEMARLYRRRFTGDPRLGIACMAIENFLATTPAKADLAVMHAVFQYVPDKLAVMRHIGRVLHPGGHFVFSYDPLRPGSSQQSEEVSTEPHAPALYRTAPREMAALAAASGLEVRTHGLYYPKPEANPGYQAAIIAARKPV